MSTIRDIVLVHHTHTDIGYTGHSAAVAAQHVRHFREALRLCRADARFRWTIESSWSLEQFLSVATETEISQLRDVLKRGAVELTGFYTQPLTQLGDLDVFCGSIEPSIEMARQFDTPISVAMLNDIAGISYNAPQVLNKYGIRHIVNGCGGWRVMLPFTTLPHVFYLQGPDGSRVTYYHLGDRHDRPAIVPAQYGYGVIYFLWPILREIDRKPARPQDDGERSAWDFHGRAGVDALLARLQRESYAHDTLLLQVAMDNGLPEPRLLEAIDHWNRTHRQPRVRVGTAGEFFDDLIQRHGASLLTFDGELTCSWTEHAITNASATAQFRRTSARLRTFASLEACSTAKPQGSSHAHRASRSLASSQSSSASFRDTWRHVMRNLVLYADHTCGISMWTWPEKVRQRGGSLWDETFDLPRLTWAAKERYASLAGDRLDEAMDRLRIELTGDDPDRPARVSVFNPHGFQYRGVVRFETAQSGIALRRGRQTIPVDTVAINSKWFDHKATIEDVPPLGVMVFDVIAADGAPAPTHVAETWTLQGNGMQVHVDPKEGSVRSITTAQGEWVDTSVGGLNETFYFNVEGVLEKVDKCGLDEPVTFHRATPTAVERLSGRSGAHSASILLRRSYPSAEGPMHVETQYVLDAAGLHVRNRVRKIHGHQKEACYFAFPLAMARPFVFHVAQQGQVTRFPQMRLPGSSNHNLGMQDFVAVTDGARTAVLVADDAPLIALGKPSYYHFDLDYPIETPALFSYAFNNLWNTNCPVYQRGGDLTFEYHVILAPGDFDAAATYRAARSAVQPPVVIPGDLRACGYPEKGVLSCSSPTVMIDRLRPMDTGEWMVCLIELSGKRQQGTLTLSGGRTIPIDIGPRQFVELTIPREG